MTITEKIEQAALSNKLYFFKEGMFYKMYNQNAMWFTMHVKAYKVHVKFVKTVNQEVYSLGFPQNVLTANSISLRAKKWEETSNYISYKIHDDISEQEYRDWCNEQEVCSSERKSNDEIISELRSFDLVNKTPMQAFTFLAKLKALI